MPFTFYEDDFEPDAMDAAKEQRIEQLKQVANDRFAPHCPECYGEIVIGFFCGKCQNVIPARQQIDLRPLPPTPAPPYTDAEIIELAASERYTALPSLFNRFPNVRQL